MGCWYLVTDLHIWTSKVHNCRDCPLQHLFLTTHNRLCWPRLFGCCRYLPWLVATGAGLPFPLPATTSDHSTHGKHPRETWKDHLRNPSLGLILLPKKEKGKKGCLLGVWKGRIVFVLLKTTFSSTNHSLACLGCTEEFCLVCIILYNSQIYPLIYLFINSILVLCYLVARLAGQLSFLLRHRC